MALSDEQFEQLESRFVSEISAALAAKKALAHDPGQEMFLDGVATGYTHAFCWLREASGGTD